MILSRSYKYRIYPTPGQIVLIRQYQGRVPVCLESWSEPARDL